MQRRVIATVVSMTSFFLPTVGTSAQIQAPVTRQTQAARLAPSAMLVNPSGVSAQLTPRTGLGPTMPAGTAIALGAPTGFQVQASVPPTTMAGAGARVQVTGTVQFPASDQQAAAINSCAVSRCAADLTVTNATAHGNVTYSLILTAFTQVDVGTRGIAASFTAEALRWQISGPGSLPIAAPAPPNVPAGASVAFFPAAAGAGVAAPPRSLGVASSFQLQDVPVGAGSTSAGNPYGTGTIQFPSSPQAMQLTCLYSCTTTLVVTNATPQVTTVYTLSGVTVNAIAIGAATTFSFTYRQIRWANYAPGSAQPAQSAGWDYTTSHALQ